MILTKTMVNHLKNLKRNFITNFIRLRHKNSKKALIFITFNSKIIVILVNEIDATVFYHLGIGLLS
jgi:hypothetical protein